MRKARRRIALLQRVYARLRRTMAGGCRRGARCPAIPGHPVMPPVSACTSAAARRASPAPLVTRPAGKLPKPPAGAAWVTGIPIAIAATPAEDGDRHVRETGRSRHAVPRLVWLA